MINKTVFGIQSLCAVTNFELPTRFGSYTPSRDSKNQEDIEYWAEIDGLSNPKVYEIYIEIVPLDGETGSCFKFSSAKCEKITKEQYELIEKGE